MYESQLMDVIRVFKADELSELRLFVHSPFFNRSNRSEAVTALFEYIYANSPSYESDFLTKKIINTRVFAGLPHVEGRLEKTMTELLKVIRLFIAQRHNDISENSINFQIAVAKFYRDRGFESKFLNAVDKLRLELSEIKQPDMRQLLQSFQAEELLHDHLIVYYNKKDDANLISTIHHLDRYYFAQRLAFTTVFNNISYMTRMDAKSILPVAELFEKIIANNAFPEIPMIEGYYHACNVLTKTYPDSEIHFQALRRLIEEKAALIPQDHLFNLGNILRNHCVIQMNSGKQAYQDIYIDLFKSQLSRGILYYQGGILVSILQNMIITGLRAGEFDWVLEVLEGHKDRITGTRYPVEVYQYNLSNYYFHRKDYDKSLELLAYNYEDVWYLIRARNLEIKIFYEKGDWNLVDAKLEAYKIYLIRLSKKYLPDQAKEAYINFVNLTKRLLHANGVKRRSLTQKLITQTREATNTVDKEWLIEKLEELAD